MVFASHQFIVFLIAALGLYWLSSRLGSLAPKYVFIVISLVFYAYWIPSYTLILVASILFNYGIFKLAARRPQSKASGFIIAFGVTADLALLAYFKYAAFAVESLNAVFSARFAVPDILLPIGISFYTFEQISFLIDFRRGEVERVRFSDYVFFVSFFPHLIAGPIITQKDMLRQTMARKFWGLEPENLAAGFTLFAIGLFKKSVLADPFVPFIDIVFRAAANGAPVGFIDGWVGAIGYGFQIYFDFSGYSDMAIGLAIMFGIRLPVNFFSPYKAASIREFWRGWHITLSRFLRDYLFIPLGGSRHGLPHTVAALVATMTIGGLWHGAGWTYVTWGLLHGLYLAGNHIWRSLSARGSDPQRSGKARLIRRIGGVALTYLAVTFAWTFFRADDMNAALRLATAMLGFSSFHEVAFLTRGIVPMFPVYGLIVWCLPNTIEIFRPRPVALYAESYLTKPAGFVERHMGFKLTRGWALTASATFVVAWLALTNLSPFIYFQF